jgi:hypothetical protein
MRKVATLFGQCLLGAGMFYAIVVLSATPAKAAACNCPVLAQEAGEICYSIGHAESDDNQPGMNDGGTLLECDSAGFDIRCEDSFGFRGLCR